MKCARATCLRIVVVGILIFVGSVSVGRLTPAVAAEADRLGVGDFAVGRVIEPGSSRALQSATLDLDVYRASVERGLADLRVFNAAGETVPHAIRAAPPAEVRPVERVRLPVFPIAGPGAAPAAGPGGAAASEESEDSEASGESGESGGALEIDAEISESGAIVRLRDRRPARSAPSGRAVWLVDASELDGEPIAGLEFEPAPSSEDFIAYLRVDGTDDLTSFRTHRSRAALARLTRDAHQIERLDLALPATRARYLKLEVIEGAWPGPLESVTARIATQPEAPALLRTSVAGRAIEGEPGRFVYDIQADLPIEWIDVVPGEPNTLLDVRIDSARVSGGPWANRYAGLVYRLEPGGRLRNAPIPWRGGSVRQLRLTLSPKGGVDPSSAPPDIEIGWRPARILFVARGEGPFTLAYGRRGARDVAFEASRLVGLAAEELTRLDDPAAALGPPRMLAGDRAYAPPPREVPWRRIGLWAVLVLAVGIVLRMSLRLLGGSDDSGGGGMGTTGGDATSMDANPTGGDAAVEDANATGQDGASVDAAGGDAFVDDAARDERML